jgi:ribosomal protein L11 methyltransferase
MLWQQLQLTTTAANAELVQDWLSENGAVAVTFKDAGDEPIYEPLGTTPLWQHTQITALFPLEANLAACWQQLTAHFNAIRFSEPTITRIAEQNWVALNQKDFPARRFGMHLWVCPSWQKVSDPDAIVVKLDPGMAFGTGSHETTALCLEWLAEAALKDKIVVDYGCGSGILAIAALKLGAKHVFAVDHDPQALQATQANAQQNDISPQQLSVFSPTELPQLQSDVLIANILVQSLIDLGQTFANLLRSKGKIVLSGILNEQLPLIEQAYSQWFNQWHVASQRAWSRLDGVRKQ